MTGTPTTRAPGTLPGAKVAVIGIGNVASGHLPASTSQTPTTSRPPGSPRTWPPPSSSPGPDVRLRPPRQPGEVTRWSCASSGKAAETSTSSRQEDFSTTKGSQAALASSTSSAGSSQGPRECAMQSEDLTASTASTSTSSPPPRVLSPTFDDHNRRPAFPTHPPDRRRQRHRHRYTATGRRTVTAPSGTPFQRHRGPPFVPARRPQRGGHVLGRTTTPDLYATGSWNPSRWASSSTKSDAQGDDRNLVADANADACCRRDQRAQRPGETRRHHHCTGVPHPFTNWKAELLDAYELGGTTASRRHRRDTKPRERQDRLSGAPMTAISPGPREDLAQPERARVPAWYAPTVLTD